VARTSIAAIAVATGPGQYGALRTGVATAQGLALALDVPLAGISRLEADALPHLVARAEGGAPGRTVIAVHDAGRSGLAWAAYTLDRPGGAPRCLAAPRLDPPAAVARLAPRPATWCGELTDALRAARDTERRSGDTDVAVAAGMPAGGRAVAVVRLARLHAAYGDPALVDAVYLRPPPITLPKPHEP
jgi:tRNA threonylcarbamoyladenosine biosynthesis protein TsaB